ncbi:M16 family metallopeptidase [Tropicibacter sp. S64]|uniref:M16 family metallopeptidase n=1 Tax=Tropicibacter sp. S64 TaxID=3415122 RepID=UPI003C7A1A94
MAGGCLLRLLMAGLLMLSAVCVRAEETAPPIREAVLDNGLRLVVLPVHRAPVVTHMVWYRTGSADDPYGKSGLAHFLEHLMFSGTQAHPKGDYIGAVNAVGGIQNAFTSFDFTVYFQQVPAEALGRMMAFEADRMTGLMLNAEAVAIEHEVIKEERRVRVDNDPGSMMVEEMDATLFQRHPYRNPVVGWMREIEGLTQADALAFYERYYRPDNAIVVVVGDVDFDAALALAQNSYGRLPRGPGTVARSRIMEPVVSTRRTVSLSDSRIRAAKFRKSWVVPSNTTAAPGEAEALTLLAEILGGGARSRLYTAQVLGSGTAKSVTVRYDGNPMDYGYFSFYGVPLDPADLIPLEAAFDAELARIAAQGVTVAEVDAARRRVLRGQMFERDDPLVMARYLGMVLATGGTLDGIASEAERLAAVTPDDIARVARDLLPPDRAVTGYLLAPQEVGQ